jgi:hypothetical protein
LLEDILIIRSLPDICFEVVEQLLQSSANIPDPT